MIKRIKLPTKPLSYIPLSLIALVTLLPNNAYALSTGCTDWDANILGVRNALDSTTSSDHIFTKGEVATVSLIDQGAGSTYTFKYTDTANGSAVITKSGIIGASATVTANITVPQDSTNATLNIIVDSGSMHVTLACAFTPSAAADTNTSSTTSAVVSAVSRSQVSVIQQNIGARVSAISSAVGGSATGQVPNNSGSAFRNSNITNANRSDLNLVDNSSSYNDTRYMTGANNVLRQLAMMGSFDSSTGSIFSGLGVGANDLGNNNLYGRSALSSSQPLTLWGHGSFTSVDNDYVNGTADNRYDGDVWGYNIGLDYRLNPALTTGVSIGYNDTDLSTSFNDGSYQEKGWTISPYAIYRPIDGLTMVGEIGFGQGDVDVARDNDAVTGNTDSSMWYGALTTSYKIYPDAATPLSFTPSIALIAAHKKTDSYIESDNTQVSAIGTNTRQIKPELEAAYDFQADETFIITPFVQVGMIYDFMDEMNNDKNAFNIGGGVRLSDSDAGLNAALEASYLAGRTDYTEYTVGGTITWGFDLRDENGRNLGVVTPFLGSNLNEYGNQRIRTGLNFNSGRINSALSLEHMMSIANDDDLNIDTQSVGDSRVQLQMSMSF